MKNKGNSLILNRIKEHKKFEKDAELADFLDIKPNTLANWYSRDSLDFNLIITKCEYEDLNWLLTGKTFENKSLAKEKNLIPIYNDMVTVGSSNVLSEPSASYGDRQNINTDVDYYIDAGDWFPNITAGIRHYGDSMIEYPNGCVLALRQITDIKSIIWGRNYVVETSEMRITKRMQTHYNKDYITAYSTNTETYPDGRLVHEPLEIEKKTICKIFLVLGRIVKEHSSGLYPVKIS